MKAETDRFITEGKETYGKTIQERYRLFAYLDTQQITHAYAAADLVVSRAGAGSIFELAQLGKPVIVIPLESAAGNHQVANAIEFSKSGASLLEGANMTTHILQNQIESLLEPQKYQEVSARIKNFSTPNAAEDIASALLAVL